MMSRYINKRGRVRLDWVIIQWRMKTGFREEEEDMRALISADIGSAKAAVRELMSI